MAAIICGVWFPVAAHARGPRPAEQHSRNISTAGYGLQKAPMAAWEAAVRRVEPWSRWRRQGASQGHARRLPAVATVHAGCGT